MLPFRKTIEIGKVYGLWFGRKWYGGVVRA